MKKPDWRVWIKDKEECGHWLNNYIGKKVLRKSEDESRLYLNKSNHNLNFANWVFEKHQDEIPKIFRDETFYDWIINIYYYAIYHSASALISREGYSSKNHSASLCFLIYYNYHLQNKISKEDVELVASSLNKEDIETLGNSKELRERASYDVHELFEKKLAEQIREKAVDFVNKIKMLLEEKSEEDKDNEKSKEKNEDNKEIIEINKEKKSKNSEEKKEEKDIKQGVNDEQK
ncbi:MAG: hypothetical protein KKE50_04570 [Nanoarchaeota archaeon]|nr:hypothetical protein [Nanoarchaeota archaeon]